MKNILLFFVIIALALTIVLWIRHGGGDPYPDLSTAPILNSAELEEVLAYPEPIGNVSVSRNGRVFFTVHPESRPTGNRLLEYVQGAAVPFPDLASQLELFDTVLGITIDRFDRLWTIDHGNHGLRSPRLLAIDLRDGTVLRDHPLGKDLAPTGSYLQDLQVSDDGRTIILADTSVWRKRPAIIVYDVETAIGRRVLESHPSVQAEHYLINADGKPMSFLGGIVSMRGGIDGIALSREWLYFGALNGSGLYRIPFDELRNPQVPDSQLMALVERYADKPLSGGFSVDLDGTVYIADVEHNSVFVVRGDREPRTLIKSDQLRWPDGLSFGSDGWLYVSDSALPEVVMQPREHIQQQAPYRIFRFQAGAEGVPGR